MKERALALDHVPVVRRGVGAQDLRGARHEVGDDGVDRHAAARDHDPGLPGRAEVGIDAARGASRPSSASAVYFLPSAQSVPTVSRRLPLRLRPVATGMFGGGWRTSMSRRPSRSAAALSSGERAEPPVHAGDEVEARFEALEQARDPVRLEDAARVRDADDERARATRMRLARRQLRQAGRHRAPRAARTRRHRGHAPSREGRTPSWRSPRSVTSPRNSRYGAGSETTSDADPASGTLERADCRHDASLRSRPVRTARRPRGRSCAAGSSRSRLRQPGKCPARRCR